MDLETDSRFWLNRRVNTLTGVTHRIFDEDIKPEKYPDYSHIDQFLRQRDPLSGLRDIDDLTKLAMENKLVLACDYEMPVNNRTLVWKKTD